ncbi:hypothetical protein F183_A29600 [Bryobacterales bacterium F-183]|nr:hypothetical protein F183_A29600 [Bryobacterales bacterium F-183]
MATKKLPPDVIEYFREQGLKGGRKGGLARAANLTPEQRSEIARKAVAAREAKRAAEKATGVKSPKLPANKTKQKAPAARWAKAEEAADPKSAVKKGRSKAKSVASKVARDGK